MKTINNLSLGTFGDFPAAINLVKIASELHAKGYRGKVGRAFSAIADFRYILVALRPVKDSGVRERLSHLYLKQITTPRVESIEGDEFKQLRSHSLNVIRAYYRKELQGSVE